MRQSSDYKSDERMIKDKIEVKKTSKTMLAKKGQAALEYIVTYGWGFVVILVVIGALAYFGFLNPTRYIPTRCNFGAQLECVDFKLEANPDGVSNGNVYLSFRNNFGDKIQIVNIYNMKNDRLTTLAGVPQVINKSAVANPNIKLTLPVDDDTFLVKNDRATVQLIIEFRRDPAIDAGSLFHNVSGEIFSTVQ